MQFGATVKCQFCVIKKQIIWPTSFLNCCPIRFSITLKCVYLSPLLTRTVRINICVIAMWDLKSFSQTHTLNGSCLAQLASLFVDAIKAGKMGSGKSLELFPTVLTALSACDALSYGKGKCKLLDSVNVKCKSPVSYVVRFSVRCRSYNTVNIRLTVILGELSGEEYKKQLINSLCSSR